jgi:hypothetical protein
LGVDYGSEKSEGTQNQGGATRTHPLTQDLRTHVFSFDLLRALYWRVFVTAN